MISKSLSRNSKSFESLYNYLSREQASILDSYNLYADPRDKQATIAEFLENAKYLHKARGKNYLYHEILSLPKNNLGSKEQEQILKDLASKYLTLRAENHLCFTAIHKDKDHTHMHLMISANEVMGDKRIRLSKKEFASIQKELEEYKNTLYPELEQTRHYAKDMQRFKNKKQELKAHLNELFKTRSPKDVLEQKAKARNIEFYTRGQNIGVKYESKKYRLKSLGLLEDYEHCVNSKAKEDKIKDQSRQR